MVRQRPKSVDDYLANVTSDEARAALANLRAIVRDEIPEAAEVIGYGIPTYKLNGFVIAFAAFKNHCSLFPGYTVADFADKLKGYKTSKGAIQFHHAEPLPEPLVRAIVRARVAENLSQRAAKTGK